MARRKRRTFNAEYKFETVMEALRGEKTSAQICREREISENLLSRWKSEFVERGAHYIWSHMQAKFGNKEEMSSR